MLNLTNSLFIKYINPDESSGPDICVYMCIYVLIIPGLVEVRSVGSLTMSPVDQRAIVSNIVKTQDDPPGTWSPSVLAGPVPPVAQWQDRWWPGQCHTCGRAGSPWPTSRPGCHSGELNAGTLQAGAVSLSLVC